MSVIRSIVQSLALTAVILSVMTSCGSSKTVTATHGGISSSGGGRQPVEYVEIDSRSDNHEQALLKEARKWLGTPYKYGGEDRSGIDCSALVLNVFRDALNIRLPRSSRQQYEFTNEVNKDEMIPGDLIFFATTRGSSKVSHVGLYIGDNKMVHSSASRGVMVSRINEAYFVRTFVGAGRVAPYYAMLSDKKSGKKKKNGKETEPDDNNNNVSPDKLPFTYEPVASVPGKKSQTKPAVTPVPSPSPSPAPVMLSSASSSTASVPELSAEEARMKVLNSLIEEKIDSIYSSVE